MFSENDKKAFLAQIEAMPLSSEEKEYMRRVFDVLEQLNIDPRNITEAINIPIDGNNGIQLFTIAPTIGQGTMAIVQTRMVSEPEVIEVEHNQIIETPQKTDDYQEPEQKQELDHFDDSVQLFAGQTNHKLTENEKKLFGEKIDVSECDPSDCIKLCQSVESMLENSETAREQARQIIASPRKSFKIVISPEADEEMDENSCIGRSNLETGICYIHSCLLSHPLAAETMFHEILHQRQPSSCDNLLFADAETHALSSQLIAEYKTDQFVQNFPQPKDFGYIKSYEKNREKWKQIVLGELPKPDWAPALRYRPGLTQKEQQKATELYVSQMASMETRTQYMEDFFASQQDLKNGKISSANYSYHNLAAQRSYDSESVESQQFNLKHLYSAIKDLKKRYPSLNDKKMRQTARTLQKEYQKKNKSSLHQILNSSNVQQGGVTPIEQISFVNSLQADLKYRFVSKEVYAKQVISKAKSKNWSIHDKVGMILSFANVQSDIDLESLIYQETLKMVLSDSNLNINEKLFIGANVIAAHQSKYPDRNPARDSMIRMMNKEIGIQAPYVCKKSMLQKQLENSQEYLDTSENAGKLLSDPSRNV